jgi:hypothetical protein
MDGPLSSGTLVALVAAVVALAAVVVLGALLARERRRTRAALAAVVAGQAELRRLLEERPTPAAVQPALARTEVAEFVITDAGAPLTTAAPVPDRVVLSATLGEPLVKAAAFTFGVRRALSAESRHRIRFAMRREVRRSRKHRKQEMKEAWRRMRAEDAGSAA